MTSSLKSNTGLYTRLGALVYGGRYEPLLLGLLVLSYAFTSGVLFWTLTLSIIFLEAYFIFNIHILNLTIGHAIDEVVKLEKFKENYWTINLIGQWFPTHIQIKAANDRLNWDEVGDLNEKAYYLRVKEGSIAPDLLNKVSEACVKNGIQATSKKGWLEIGSMKTKGASGESYCFLNKETLCGYLEEIFGKDWRDVYIRFKIIGILDKGYSRDIFTRLTDISKATYIT